MIAVESAHIELLSVSAQRGRSSSALNRDAQRGLLTRLRPGIFVRRRQWGQTPRWLKHMAATAAVGLSVPSAILCRETALAVCGVPLLTVPGEVHVRTLSRGMVGTSKVTVPQAPAKPRFKVCRIGPPVVSGTSAHHARSAYRHQSGAAKRTRVVVPGVSLNTELRPEVTVESLPFTLVDTLPRMSFEPAVVALDAALAGRSGAGLTAGPAGLASAEDWLRSQPARSAWRALLDFADSRAESPGESRSRVVIHQLGFVAPRLQTEVHLPGGRRRRLDFDWDSAGVIGEFDGKLKYQAELASGQRGGASVYWEEKWREDEVEEVTGKRFVRWRWQDLDQPRRLERRLLLKGVPKR